MGLFGVLGSAIGTAIGGPIGGLFGGAIGGGAESIVGHHQARKAYRQQAASIAEQQALNREVADFNESVIKKMYPQVREGIFTEMRRVLGRQMVSFAQAGSAPGSASPYFVLGDIYKMGKQRLQEAEFNYSVDLKNEQFRARGIDNSLSREYANARANSRAEGFKMWNGIFDTVSTLGGIASYAFGQRDSSYYTEALNRQGMGFNRRVY